VSKHHLDESIRKVHPTMNKLLKDSYQRIQTHFKGGLPKEVQPPEYQ
jgi:transitional endoplasmic reticulum ATPase